MKEKIEALARQFQQELEGAGTSDAVEKLRVAYLGRKGSVTQLLKGLKEVEAQQKKELGQHINMLKKTVEDKLSQQVEAIRRAEEQRLVEAAEQYDVTLPVGSGAGSFAIISNKIYRPISI